MVGPVCIRSWGWERGGWLGGGGCNVIHDVIPHETGLR